MSLQCTPSFGFMGCAIDGAVMNSARELVGV
jgi:hypothetical protein